MSSLHLNDDDRRFGLLLGSYNVLPINYVEVQLVDLWPRLLEPLRKFDRDEVLTLFKYCAYVSDGVERPDSELTVYRGQLRISKVVGFSWTTNRVTAMNQYTAMYAPIGDAVTLKATISPERVLACFRRDDEVIIDPSGLKWTEIYEVQGRARPF